MSKPMTSDVVLARPLAPAVAPNASARRMLGMPGSSRVPAPVPVRAGPAAAARRRRRREMAKDRGARRRDALAGDAVVAQREALQQQRGGRRRHGQQPVRACAPARAARQGGDAPARALERRGDAAAPPTTSISESQSAISWKCTSSTGTPWIARLGLGEVAQDGERVRRGAGRERRGRDARRHAAKAASCVVARSRVRWRRRAPKARSAGSAGRRWCRVDSRA